jgi:hypothetical protein
VATTTYYLTTTASDLGTGSNWSNTLPTTAPGTTTLNSSIANEATENDFAYTPSGDPGANGGSGSQNYTVAVEINTANTDVTLEVLVCRVNSSGTEQHAPVSLGGPTTTSVGTMTYGPTSANTGTWASGDRLQVEFQWVNANKHGGDEVITQDIGSAGTSVTAPWGAITKTITGGVESDVAAALSVKKHYTLNEPVSVVDADVTSGLSVSPTAYYKFDESSGSLLDSANSNDLTVTAGTVTYGEDGVRADGNDAVSLGGDCELTATGFSPFTTGNDLSVAFWAKVPTGFSSGAVWCGDEASTDYPYSTLAPSGDNILFTFSPNLLGGSKTVTYTGANDGGWHHYAFAFDNSANTVDWWFDGASQTQSTGLTTDFATTDALRIGSGPNDTSYLDGRLDEFVLVENGLLTDADVSLLTHSEQDVAGALSVDKRYTLTGGVEADVAGTLSIDKKYTLTGAAEADVAQALSVSGPIEKTITGGVESDVAQSLAREKHYTFTGSTETDVAGSLTADKHYTITTGTEADVSGSLSVDKHYTLTNATEADVSGSLTTDKKYALTGAAEADVAGTLQPARAYTITGATEADVAAAIVAVRRYTLTGAVEQDLASALTYVGVPEDQQKKKPVGDWGVIERKKHLKVSTEP